MTEKTETVLRLARQAGFKFHSGFLNGETRSLPLCLSELEYFYHLVLEEERKKEVEKPDTAGKKVCKCDLRTKLVGDGCKVCNPELAAEIEKELNEDAD